MMFAKTFCKPGSYVEVAPIGLQAALQYNKNGLLQKVLLLEPSDSGHQFCREVDKDVLRKVYSMVPTTISLKDGTTWIEGTFITSSLPTKSSGNIAYCATDEYLSMMKSGVKFEFYGGNVRSLAASFKGALTIRNWLASHGFKTLPGVVVPVEMKQETIDMMLKTFNASLRPNFLGGFYIFEGIEQARFVLSDFYYATVLKCQMELSSDGFVKGVIALDTKDVIVLNYSDACTYYCDSAPNVRILYTYTESGAFNILTSVCSTAVNKTTSYTCPVCHKQVALTRSGPCQCNDSNCLSRLYLDSCKMLDKLHLPQLSYTQYMEHVNNHDILCLTDILLLDNYKDIKPSVTLADTISALVPISTVSDVTFFEKFVNSCNNSVDSVLYYLKNPERISTELGMQSAMLNRFIKWISDPYNLTSVQTLLSAVNIKTRTKKFEGAPIFRNNSFVLTGKFKRGHYSEIASILESYDAKVLNEIDILGTHKVPTALVIGSTNEDISGSLVKSARSRNIPIVEEDEFFRMYGIDEDLAANLL